MTFGNKNIIFFGTSFFAKEILASLLDKKIPISLVVTQPSKPFGRKKELKDSEVKKFALENQLEVLEFDKIKTAQIELFEKRNPDLIITAAYGSLLPKKLLSLPKIGALNVHPSLLPKHRGPSPIQYALLKGDKQTGTTIMLMNEEMDAGDILSQREIDIDPKDNYASLEKKLLEESKELLSETLEKLINGKLRPQKQDTEKATFTKIIKKEDGLISWNCTAQEIANKHRAYSQWPKIFSFFQDGDIRKKIIFHEIDLLKSLEKFEPGKVTLLEKNVIIGTKSGAIVPKKIQLEGKSLMTIEQFILGKKNFIGSLLG